MQGSKVVKNKCWDLPLFLKVRFKLDNNELSIANGFAIEDNAIYLVCSETFLKYN